MASPFTTSLSSLSSSVHPSSTSSLHPTSATSSAGSATTTPASDGGGATSSKPLLFFVALGFGVVFTNLWIIVGVKYCFRYNQRARNGWMNDENGDPIDLGNVQRPRRRREKKLMTMDEVNERFPLTKYKIWRATREQEGLPAAGGVTANASRAASIKDVAVGRKSADGRKSTDHTRVMEEEVAESSQPPSPVDARHPPPREVALNEKSGVEKVSESSDPLTMQTTAQSNSVVSLDTQTKADEDEDDPIQHAVPQELLASPGDACAICIETLEDDDEVRGLSCGHAFHASCIDPWLTSRRACCPLCKADYYVPKPRPEGEAANPETENSTTPVAEPARVYDRRSRVMLVGPGLMTAYRDRYSFPSSAPRRQSTRSDAARSEGAAARSRHQSVAEVESAPETQNVFRQWASSLSAPRVPRFGRRRSDGAAAGASDEPVTPRQLESATT